MNNVTVSMKQALSEQANAYHVTVSGPAGTHKYTAHTGPKGKGLWIDGEQVEGNAQFSAGKNPRETMRRWFQSRGF
jgi:hypothetical protein